MNNFVDKNSLEIKENVLAGIVGAFLFSLAGAVVYFLLNLIGYVSAISGLVGAVCAVKGYAIFSKKESKKGIVISVIISLLVIALAWYLSMAYDIYNACKIAFEAGEIDISITFFQSVRMVPSLLEDPEISGTYFYNLGLGLFCCLLGCASFVISKLKNSSKKKAEALKASLDQIGPETKTKSSINE